MAKVLIDNLNVEGNNAGPKARADIRYFLHQEGFSDLSAQEELKSWIKKEDFLWRKIPMQIKQLPVDSKVVIQYPIYSKVLMKRIVKAVRKHGCDCYLIIHDIESLRIFKNRPHFQKYEIKLINQTSGVIVHNQIMQRELAKMGIKVPMIPLELFDYQTDQPIVNHQQQKVAFAGNLAKSTFLSKCDFKTEMDVFGPNRIEYFPKNIIYQGSFKADLLPGKLTQGYGLVWDGNNLERCNGMYGEYLKYNNPHKFSLYLSAGMPVVTWKKAAIAKFIEDYQVGIVVDHLSELDQALSQITEQQYQTMVSNAKKIANKARKGYYIKTALAKLIK